MGKITSILMGIGLVLAGAAIAEETPDPNWVRMGTNEDSLTKNVFSAKNGTFKHIKKESSILMQNAEENKATKKTTITYNKIAISDEDCENGYGKTKFFSIDGKFLFAADYIEGGRSMGSSIGQIICEVKAELTRQGKI